MQRSAKVILPSLREIFSRCKVQRIFRTQRNNLFRKALAKYMPIAFVFQLCCFFRSSSTREIHLAVCDFRNNLVNMLVGAYNNNTPSSMASVGRCATSHRGDSVNDCAGNNRKHYFAGDAIQLAMMI